MFSLVLQTHLWWKFLLIPKSWSLSRAAYVAISRKFDDLFSPDYGSFFSVSVVSYFCIGNWTFVMLYCSNSGCWSPPSLSPRLIIVICSFTCLYMVELFYWILYSVPSLWCCSLGNVALDIPTVTLEYLWFWQSWLHRFISLHWLQTDCSIFSPNNALGYILIHITIP